MLPCSHSELVNTHKQHLLSPISHIQKSSKQYQMYTVSRDQSCVNLFFFFFAFEVHYKIEAEKTSQIKTILKHLL